MRCCLSVCPLGVSVALCCFISPGVRLSQTAQTSPPSQPRPSAPRLSVRFYFALRTFAVNCLCFLSSLTSPNISHLLSLYFCSSLFSSSPLSFFIFTSLLPSATCTYLIPPFVHSPPPSFPPSLPPPGLCCAVAAHRSDQDRWSQMISGLYSFLQETAWYCCCHDALSGCLQVQSSIFYQTLKA